MSKDPQLPLDVPKRVTVLDKLRIRQSCEAALLEYDAPCKQEDKAHRDVSILWQRSLALTELVPFPFNAIIEEYFESVRKALQ